MKISRFGSIDLRIVIILVGVNLVLILTLSSFVDVPGYMDAEYYYAGGIQLVRGNGFTEPYVWNYLDGITYLPRPSHTYWMPMVSIMSAIGMWITSNESFNAGRIVFLIGYLALPVFIYALTKVLGFNEKTAVLTGFVSLFPGYYLPYFVTTDAFVVMAYLGGVYFIILNQITLEQSNDGKWWLLLGGTTGVIHLTRSEGLIWFVLTCILLLFYSCKNHLAKSPSMNRNRWLLNYSLFIIGYLIPMSPWYLRNIGLFSSAMSPAGTNLLWLTSYDQLFSYPPSSLTFQSWFASGIPTIINDRINSLMKNLLTLVAIQNNIYLFPLSLLGIIAVGTKKFIQSAAILWFGLLIIFSVIFPYAGARGGFFHAGVAFQPLFWITAVVGLDKFISIMVKKRQWKYIHAWRFFSIALIITGIIYSAFTSISLITGFDSNQQPWSHGWQRHQSIARVLDMLSVPKDSIIMVNNPPGFFLVSGRHSIVIPDGTPRTAIEVADLFNADYVIVEPNHPVGWESIYKKPSDIPGLKLIRSEEEYHLYKFTRVSSQ